MRVVVACLLRSPFPFPPPLPAVKKGEMRIIREDRSLFFRRIQSFNARATSNGRGKKKAPVCYGTFNVRPRRSAEMKNGRHPTSIFTCLGRARTAHAARNHFITFHVLLTLANVCFTSVLCPRKHLQHSSSVYLRDTADSNAGGLRRGGEDKLNTHDGPRGSPLRNPDPSYAEARRLKNSARRP